MAEKKKESLLLYVDWLETLELVKPAERGLIFSNLLRYVGQLPLLSMNSRTEVLFHSVLRQVNWDLEKWRKTTEARAKAGRKGGLASGENRREKQREAKEAEYENETVYENETDHDYDTPSRECARGWEGQTEGDPLIRFYCQTVEAEPAQWVLRELEDYRSCLGDELCRKAIAISGENGAVSWQYVRAVLENMKARGIRSVAQLQRRPPRGAKQFITAEPRELSEVEKQAIAMVLQEFSEEEDHCGIPPEGGQ